DQSLEPLEALARRDPKNDLAKYFLGVVYSRAGMYGKAFLLELPLLSKDQGNMYFCGIVAGNLESLGDMMNSRYLREKIAARFSESGVVQKDLANFYVDYAWYARGNGWASSVSSWNFFLFERRLAIARRIFEKAEKLNPKDDEILLGLLQVGKGQGWKKE